MTPLLLVHGAWHGSWAWDRTLTSLGAHSVPATAIDLPGHDGHPEVTLQDQVRALTRTLRDAPEPVVVVAHSHAGIVAQQAIAAEPDRCRALIGVDAWFGHSGQSFFDLVPPAMRRALLGTVRGPAGRQVVPIPPLSALGVPADTRPDPTARLRDQPLRTFTDPIELPAAEPTTPGAAILCRPSQLPFDRIAADRGLPTSTIASGHDVPLIRPTDLADQLIRWVTELLAD